MSFPKFSYSKFSKKRVKDKKNVKFCFLKILILFNVELQNITTLLIGTFKPETKY